MKWSRVLMAARFKIRNFKGLSEESGILETTPITVLIGPNSSGKSSYLQALLMLKQTIDSRDKESALITNSSYVNLGSYFDFIKEHKVKTPLEIEIEFKLASRYRPLLIRLKKALTNLLNSGDKGLSWIDLEKDFKLKVVFNQLSNLQINVSSLAVLHQDKELYSLQYAGRGNYDFYSKYFILDSDEIRSKDYRPVKFYGLPPIEINDIDNEAVLSSLSRVLERSIENYFRNIYYIGPLRDYPKRIYVATGERPEDVGFQGEKAVEVLISSISNKKDTLLDTVNYWLKELGLGGEVLLERVKGGGHFYFKFKKLGTNIKVNVADIGFGVSQILPVIIQTFYSADNSKLIIEQPEIHLHPRIQAKFADMIIQASKNKTFIIETHSEHFITRIQRRIAEGELLPKNVSVYFCENGDNGTKLTKLEIDEYGQFAEWPTGLFEEEFEDHFQIVLASSRKKGERDGNSN